MSWSDDTWQRAVPVFRDIVQMPFITELSAGTLSTERFRFYMAQDAVYLDHFGRALATIASKVPEMDAALDFIKFAEGAIVVENALHQFYFSEFGVKEKPSPEPACHHYIHYLKSAAAFEPVEVAMAAVLPCFWIYQKVGDYILTHSSLEGNPYEKWILTYAGEEFARSVQRAINLCDRIATSVSDDRREQMAQAFLTASRLEWMFWEAAYQLRTWQKVTA